MNKLYRQCKKGFRALEFPFSEGGGDSPMYKVCRKVLYKKILVRVSGLWEHFSNFRKSAYGQKKGEYGSRNLGKIERNMVR